jgi:hypothetical protein
MSRCFFIDLRRDCMDDNKRIIVLGLQIPFLLALIVSSFFIMVIFFTAAEYTTHSNIQEYVRVDPKGDFIRFTISFFVYLAASIFFISIRRTYKYVTVICSILLAIIHSIYFYWSVIGTMDVMPESVHMMGMIYVSNFVNIFIVIYSLFIIVKRLRGTN